MSEVERLEKLIQSELSDIKSGSLRFWGEWFGRPHDNIHRIVSCEAEKDILRLKFNEDEVLCVWSPINGTVSKRTFKIEDAAHVRWEWYYYGRPKTKENLFFMDFIKTCRYIETSTNVNWYIPDLKPTLNEAAVEIL